MGGRGRGVRGNEVGARRMVHRKEKGREVIVGKELMSMWYIPV